MADFSFVDHFVFAGPDLNEAMDLIEERFGVRPTDGGAHVGLGTRNGLLALGGTTYLEVIGPDLEQDDPSGSRPFGIDDLEAPRLVTWASPSSHPDDLIAKAKRAGVDLGFVIDMSRRKPDGELLEWRLTVRSWDGPVVPVPFFIDWGQTPSPAATLQTNVSLSSFTIAHPKADEVNVALSALGLPVEATASDVARLEITIETQKGLVTLL